MVSEFRTMQEIIYDELKERIISGVYQPGMRLIASDLASEFNISRMPVREALTRLGSTGLVELIPYKGAIVNELTAEDYVEIFHIRSVLEGLAARLACPNLRPEDIEQMAKANEEIHHMISEDDVEFQRVNRIFHATIWKRTKSERLQSLLSDLYSESTQYRQLVVIHSDRLGEIYKEHQNFLKALEAGDARLAEQMVREHYENTLEWLIKLVHETD
jgi:DNA-binding GntR family transcriptional regulator